MQTRIRLSLVGYAWCATWLTMAGCVTTRPTTPSGEAPPPRELTMEPLHIGLSPDPELGLTDFDAAILFREGLRHQEAGDCERALVFYGRLQQEFADSRYLSSATFNAGRCLEERGDWLGAAERYRLIVEQLPRSKDWVDAAFRLGGVLAAAEHWAEAGAVYDHLLERTDLPVAERVDAAVLRAEAWVKTGDLLEAEHGFRAALRLFREHERDEYLDPTPAARAEFRLAELAERRFQQAPLNLPEAQMQADLEAKAQLLLEAQAGFLRVIRWADPEWAIGAGYRIARLYLDLHAAMEAAPVPPDLTPDEAETYRDMLRKRLSVLLRKALRLFELTLQLAERTGADNEWSQAARREMAEVERRVLSQLEPLPGAD